jgi:hypothetical protein
MPKWARLITRSMPHVTDNPAAIMAYMPPIRIPVIAA